MAVPHEKFLSIRRIIQLADVIFFDKGYSFKHPHMRHWHADVFELLYIAEESGRYIVGNYEYAVTAGDFVIWQRQCDW